MATKIEWTDDTWNPIAGCNDKSAGCLNCYARGMAARLEAMGQAKYAGLTVLQGSHRVWTGKISFDEKALFAPLSRKKPTRYFVNSMSDLFHHNVTDEQIDRVFAVMALCPQHTFQVLTKRPDRMSKYVLGAFLWDRIGIIASTMIQEHQDVREIPSGILPNVWLGVSVEDQKTADERIPLLLQTPAAVRFISAEPLLGSIDLGGLQLTSVNPYAMHACKLDAFSVLVDGAAALDWVIVGGESGLGARPMHPDWVRSLRDQCEAAGVPFFFKQWGELAPGAQGAKYGNTKLATRIDRGGREVTDLPGLWDASDALFYRVGKKAAGHLLDGKEHHQFPAVKA